MIYRDLNIRFYKICRKWDVAVYKVISEGSPLGIAVVKKKGVRFFPFDWSSAESYSASTLYEAVGLFLESCSDCTK